MKLVVDASVALKWIINDPSTQPTTDAAKSLLEDIVLLGHEMVQPVHWLTEIVAVLARSQHSLVDDALTNLAALPFETFTEASTCRRSAELAHRLKQHVFDSHCHAVASERGATLITADLRSFTAAQSEGRHPASRRPHAAIEPSTATA